MKTKQLNCFTKQENMELDCKNVRSFGQVKRRRPWVSLENISH